MKNPHTTSPSIQLGLFGYDTPVVPGSAAEQPGGRPIRRGKVSEAQEVDGQCIWSSTKRPGIVVDLEIQKKYSKFSGFYPLFLMQEEDKKDTEIRERSLKRIGFIVALGCSMFSYDDPNFIKELEANPSIIYKAHDIWMRLAMEINKSITDNDRKYIVFGFNAAYDCVVNNKKIFSF